MNCYRRRIHEWVSHLDGVEERLRQGGMAAGVGCGRGAIILRMARFFPHSVFAGFDPRDESIRLARQRAVRHRLDDRVAFEVAEAWNYPGRQYDLVVTFGALGGSVDPIDIASHIRDTLRIDGTWLMVAPVGTSIRLGRPDAGGDHPPFPADTESETYDPACRRRNEMNRSSSNRLRDIALMGGFGTICRLGDARSHAVWAARA